MSDNFDIDPDLVRKLADLLNETGLAEIEYEDNGKRVRVAMPGAGAVTAAVAAPPVAAAAAPAPGGGDAAAHPGAVTAPMVGTVYLAQSPEDPPFVKAGDTVREGQTLLLSELGARLKHRDSSLIPKNYGFASLTKLLEASPGMFHLADKNTVGCTVRLAEGA